MPQKSEDRRKYQRHKIENSVSETPNGVFQIVDISLGGYCLKCPPFTTIPDAWTTDLLNPIKHLEGYSVERVWVSVPDENSGGFLPMSVGVRFGKLTTEMTGKLSQVIQGVFYDNPLEQ